MREGSANTKTFIDEIIQSHGGRDTLPRRLDYLPEVVGKRVHAVHLLTLSLHKMGGHHAQPFKAMRSD